MHLLTAAGIYLLWREILRPLLRAAALIVRAAILIPVAILQGIGRARGHIHRDDYPSHDPRSKRHPDHGTYDRGRFHPDPITTD